MDEVIETKKESTEIKKKKERKKERKKEKKRSLAAKRGGRYTLKT